MYIARFGRLKKDDVEAGEGRADPQERGSAGGGPRREETPRRRETTNC